MTKTRGGNKWQEATALEIGKSLQSFFSIVNRRGQSMRFVRTHLRRIAVS